MNLDDLIADHERQLRQLEAWQAGALKRLDSSLERAVEHALHGSAQATDSTATAQTARDVGAATLDDAAERHAAMAQQVLAATAAYERKVLEAVRDSPQGRPGGAQAGPAAGAAPSTGPVSASPDPAATAAPQTQPPTPAATAPRQPEPDAPTEPTP